MNFKIIFLSCENLEIGHLEPEWGTRLLLSLCSAQQGFHCQGHFMTQDGDWPYAYAPLVELSLTDTPTCQVCL